MNATDPKRAAQQVWGASPAGWTFADGAQPETREYFERVIRKRSAYEQPWLARLVPFEKHRGKRVLELGCGAGYDAYSFARAGARYVGIDITAENVERTRAHLRLMGLDGDVRQADAEDLPFDDEAFDSIYSNGVLHHTPDISRALAEAERVLAPGGDIYLIVYHRDSAFHWLTLYLWGWWLQGDRNRYASFQDRLARIEHRTAVAAPLVNVYSRSEVRRVLRAAGFEPTRLSVRKLVHEDLPMGQRWPVRSIPQSVLDTFGRALGWYVVAHARKPEPR